MQRAPAAANSFAGAARIEAEVEQIEAEVERIEAAGRAPHTAGAEEEARAAVPPVGPAVAVGPRERRISCRRPRSMGHRNPGKTFHPPFGAGAPEGYSRTFVKRKTERACGNVRNGGLGGLGGSWAAVRLADHPLGQTTGDGRLSQGGKRRDNQISTQQT